MEIKEEKFRVFKNMSFMKGTRQKDVPSRRGGW